MCHPHLANRDGTSNLRLLRVSAKREVMASETGVAGKRRMTATTSEDTMSVPGLDLAGDIATARQELRESSDYEFVDGRRFCDLLISNESLDECDFAELQLRGLACRKSGRQFVVEEERLTSFRRSAVIG